ncbi:MAG: hypothetical protein MRY83_06350, partial [Flavobacteriales bacterium]|nr:hypothetical protein [Flavobacteriales bacterium]
MKLSLILLLLFTTIFQSNAQLFTVGGGATYAINQELTGVNLRTYANSGHAFSFGPEFSFYPEQTVQRDSFDIKAQLMDVN